MPDETAQPERSKNASSVPGCRTVLVDTSLLIEQQKRSRYADPVRQALAGYRFKGASSFSRLEFKYAWLKRMAYIYEVTRKMSVKSVVDVREWITNKLQGLNMQRGQVQTLFQILEAFYELNSGKLSGKAQLVRLRAHCKIALLDASEGFTEMITAEFNGTDCARAKDLAKECADGSFDVSIPKCRRGKKQCLVDDFFQEHRDFFAAIASRIRATDDPSRELQEMEQHIRAAMENPDYLREDQNCRKIGDAIIAVDGSNMEVFAANNDGEWRTIATAMNKPLVNPVTRESWPVSK